MQMTTAKNIPFIPRKAATKAAQEAVQPTPELTQWDKDYAEYGDAPEYRLKDVLLAMSWAYQTGRIKLGDKFLAECRKNAFAHGIQLWKELGDYLNEADFDISLKGTEDQRDE